MSFWKRLFRKVGGQSKDKCSVGIMKRGAESSDNALLSFDTPLVQRGNADEISVTAAESSDLPSILPQVLAEMYTHAQETYPEECCGFLLGPRDSTTIDEIRRCINQQGLYHSLDPERFPRTARDAWCLGGKDLRFLMKSVDSPRPVKIIYYSLADVGAFFSAYSTQMALAQKPDSTVELCYPVDYIVIDVQADHIAGAKLFRWNRPLPEFIQVAKYGPRESTQRIFDKSRKEVYIAKAEGAMRDHPIADVLSTVSEASDATTYQEWCLLAEQGHADAQASLGEMYYSGQGVPQDSVEAAKWWRKAAQQGHAMAQAYLGEMYTAGVGVPQDDAEAAIWYWKAAEQGLADAQHNLGVMSTNSRGVPQDSVEAATWYRKAAEQGDAQAQVWLHSQQKQV